MKAWHCFEGDPWECSLLVFAESAGRAKVVAWKNGTWEYDFISLRARRAPTWDQFADRERAIDTNEDLPDGAAPFYNDEYV
jgi:hypothetical protein